MANSQLMPTLMAFWWHTAVVLVYAKQNIIIFSRLMMFSRPGCPLVEWYGNPGKQIRVLAGGMQL